MRWLLSLLCCVLWVQHAAAVTQAGCAPAITAAEAARGTAPGLLAAIGLVESGRMDPRTGRREPWPWTVTAEGTGTFYAGKPEAMAAVLALQARGVASIDVGCMQVNLLHHRAAFRDLNEAFDPRANTLYAARFLTGLRDRLKTWPAAAEAYHSMTPDLGARYGKLIAAVWAGAPVPVVTAPGGMQVVTFRDGGQMRIIRDAVNGPGRVLGYLSGP